MREIKFRAFFSNTKNMIHWPQIQREFGMCELDGLASSLMFMQFTGLKDCKGTEIYEGDIVEVVEELKYSKLHQCMRHRSIYGPRYIAPVVWNTESTGFTMVYRWPDGNADDHLRITPKETTVIGNIYENPELL